MQTKEYSAVVNVLVSKAVDSKSEHCWILNNLCFCIRLSNVYFIYDRWLSEKEFQRWTKMFFKKKQKENGKKKFENRTVGILWAIIKRNERD